MENKQPITITTKTTENIDDTLYNPHEEEDNQQEDNELPNFQQLEDEFQLEQLSQQIPNQQNSFFQISDISKEKRNLIRQIRKYRELFSKNIVTMKDMITDDKLINYDEKMLQNLLIEVDEEISCIESVKTLKSFIETALTMYEKTFSMFNVDINGFKSDLLSDESFNNSIARLIIRSNVSLSPERTIILKVIESTYKNLKISKQKALLPAKTTKKIYVDSSDIEKYKDL